MASGSTRQVGTVWFVVARWIRSIFGRSKLAKSLVDEQKSKAYNEVLYRHMSVNWRYVVLSNSWEFAYEAPATGIPIITQSDPGTENNGVANAHTVMRHRLDPSLANTLQHRFARGHNNILSEIKWSVFRRDFSPGFEDMLEQGVQSGWYDVNDALEK
jgi:hypothetical protein